MTESESVALPLGDTPIFFICFRKLLLLRYFSKVFPFYQAFLCRFNKIFLSDRRNRMKLRRRIARPQASIAFAAKSLLVPLRQEHPYATRTFAEKTSIRAARSCKKIARGTFKRAAPLQKGAPVRAFDGRRKPLRQKRRGKRPLRAAKAARDESGAQPLRPTKALRRSFRL